MTSPSCSLSTYQFHIILFSQLQTIPHSCSYSSYTTMADIDFNQSESK
ncbi:hypothetical protein LSH36_555g03053 [Paralvinella palmiformis]|uniref:Uncharacterized protein n=1 Tax=Paralvinella palmiformis TaxID=53620 RepID=A0AAD9J7P8_9ANNE|nr:hypothetical protein LSH36_555g03053 [Paralvinella palmiformis]